MRKVFTLMLMVIFHLGYSQTGDTLEIDSLGKNTINSFVENSTQNYKATSGDNNQIQLNTPDFKVTGSKVIISIILLIIGYVSIRLISKILEIFAERSTKHRITIKGFIPVIRILGWVFVISIIIVGVFHPPAATVLAFSASIGVAVGFASQDILKNIFGGIMILFDRPFQTGDKIEVGSHYGEVVEIGLRSTRIITPDDSLVSIPNSEIMNSSVSNSNAGESNCQVVAEIFLPLNINTSEVRDLAENAAKISKYVFLNKPITVLFFNEIIGNRSFIKMKVKAYVYDIRDEFKFKSELTELIIDQLVKNKVITEADFNNPNLY